MVERLRPFKRNQTTSNRNPRDRVPMRRGYALAENPSQTRSPQVWGHKWLCAGYALTVESGGASKSAGASLISLFSFLSSLFSLLLLCPLLSLLLSPASFFMAFVPKTYALGYALAKGSGGTAPWGKNAFALGVCARNCSRSPLPLKTLVFFVFAYALGICARNCSRSPLPLCPFFLCAGGMRRIYIYIYIYTSKRSLFNK